MKHFSARRCVPPAQQGLTLIGQMMVLLVAGVLGAVALSSWLDLQVRERATDAYNQMEAIKPVETTAPPTDEPEATPDPAAEEAAHQAENHPVDFDRFRNLLLAEIQVLIENIGNHASDNI